MIGYIYITTNLINNKKYIGLKTSQEFESDYFGSGLLIKKGFKKYGKENFKVKILEECNTIEELRECERKWIQKYNAQKDKSFYNIAEGGQWGNCIEGMSEEQKKEYKEKLSEGVKNSYDTHPNLRQQRREQRQKMKGSIIVSEVERKKRSERFKKIWTERREELLQIHRETVQRCKENGIYKQTWETHRHPWIGRKHSEETKKKISAHTDVKGVKNPNRKKGKIFYKNELIFNFELTKEAHEFLANKGFSRNERYRMLKGETIQNHTIQREDATTIENNKKIISE